VRAKRFYGSSSKGHVFLNSAKRDIPLFLDLDFLKGSTATAIFQGVFLRCHVSSMGTRRTKCSSKFETISTNRPTVEVVSCESDIEMVIMNTNNIKRMHSTRDASG